MLTAQATAADALWNAAVWMGVLLAVLATSAVLLTLFRRRWLGDAQHRESGLTIADIRRLRQQGRLSASESEYLIRSIVDDAGGRGPPKKLAPAADKEVQSQTSRGR